MIQFVPATREHVRAVALEMRDRDLAEFSALTFYDDRTGAADMLAPLYGGHPAVECALFDGRPAAVGGMIQTRPGVVSLLFFATDDFARIVRPITHYVQTGPMARAKKTANRIECFSHVEHTEMRQWVELFGLRPQATLPRYGKRGEDFLVYAWLRDEAGNAEAERV